MAKQYHPDVNQDKEAEDIFKLVNRAHETLSNPTKKKIYDQRLKSGYFLEGLQKFRNTKEERIRRAQKRREEMAQKSREYEIGRYERALKRFSLSARLLTFGSVLILGVFLWFKFWFINLANYSVFVLILGIFMTVVSIALLVDVLYRRLRISQLKNGKDNHHDRNSIWIFVLSVALVPFAVAKTNDWRKTYHLEHYPEYVLANIKDGDVYGEDVIYTYRVDGKKYEKNSTKMDFIYGTRGKYWMIVKYSAKDPILATPVHPIENAHELFEGYH